MQLTDEDITRAAKEVSRAIIDSLPDPADCKHEFSERFHEKMAVLLKEA